MGQAARDENNVPALIGWDATGHQVANVEITGVATDTANGQNVKYGKLSTSVNNFPSTQRVTSQIGDIDTGAIEDLLTLLTLAGTPSDANTVNSFMGRLTKIRDLLNSIAYDSTDKLKASFYGKNSSAGDTPVLLDSGGRVQGNIAQWGGSAPSVSNPVITEDQIRNYINAGQGFSASTGKQTAAGAITAGYSIFNPAASGKTLIIFSILITVGNNSFNNISYTTSDPALTSALTLVNRKAGSATASVCNGTFQNTNATPSGTTNDTISGVSNANMEALLNGDVLIIPANNGFAIWPNLSGANSWSVAVQWVEV